MTSLNSNLNLVNNQYLQVNGISPQEFPASRLIQNKGVITQLSARLATKQPSGQHGYKFTVRVDGKDTSLSVTVANGAIQANTSSMIHLPAMSLVSVRCTAIGTPNVCPGCVTYVSR